MAFGLLIFVHELGHFLAARAVGIKVNDFSLGMGPRLWHFRRGETDFSLRAIPIGGSCSMEGETDESFEPRAFTNKPRLSRALVLVAGSFMNLLLGFVILFILISPIKSMTTSVISGFPVELGDTNQGLLAGDKIIKIGGERVYIPGSDIPMLLERYSDETYTVTVIRDGKRVEIKNVSLEYKTYTDNEGKEYKGYGLTLSTKEATFGGKLGYTFNYALDYVRLIRISLVDLFTGKVGAEQITGPVGITAAISEAVKTNEFRMLWNLIAFIAINLAVVNMLPLPALDGGRMLFLAVEAVGALFGRKRINPKYENYIHLAGLMLFMLLMVYVTYNDIVRLIK
jgi:regulator of sigma E protease